MPWIFDCWSFFFEFEMMSPTAPATLFSVRRVRNTYSEGISKMASRRVYCGGKIFQFHQEGSFEERNCKYKGTHTFHRPVQPVNSEMRIPGVKPTDPGNRTNEMQASDRLSRMRQAVGGVMTTQNFQALWEIDSAVCVAILKGSGPASEGFVNGLLDYIANIQDGDPREGGHWICLFLAGIAEDVDISGTVAALVQSMTSQFSADEISEGEAVLIGSAISVAVTTLVGSVAPGMVHLSAIFKAAIAVFCPNLSVCPAKSDVGNLALQPVAAAICTALKGISTK